MDIQFVQDDLREIANGDKKPRKWPSERFKLFHRRLQALGSASNLEEARSIAGHLEELKHNPGRHIFSVRLDGGQRLIFEPTQKPPPEYDGGQLIWKCVTAIRVLRIEDYHG